MDQYTRDSALIQSFFANDDGPCPSCVVPAIAHSTPTKTKCTCRSVTDAWLAMSWLRVQAHRYRDQPKQSWWMGTHDVQPGTATPGQKSFDRISVSMMPLDQSAQAVNTAAHVHASEKALSRLGLYEAGLMHDDDALTALRRIKVDHKALAKDFAATLRSIVNKIRLKIPSRHSNEADETSTGAAKPSRFKAGFSLPQANTVGLGAPDNTRILAYVAGMAERGTRSYQSTMAAAAGGISVQEAIFTAPQYPLDYWPDQSAFTGTNEEAASRLLKGTQKLFVGVYGTDGISALV
jgi:hypothetical protein